MQDLFKSLAHPSEVIAITKFLLSSQQKQATTRNKVVDHADTKAACFQYLNLTSRSFASVVAALDQELRTPICLFYLVLRALDTVEDDMTIDATEKLPLLRSFYQKLTVIGWTFCGNGHGEKDRELLVHFDVVIAEFLKLKGEYQVVIEDICNSMGNGMADFVDKGVFSMEDYGLYCHYVAGLVGIGLSKMFAASGLEQQLNCTQDLDYLSNQMGLFLQKVNIIRDFKEDLDDGRSFWPRDVCSLYSKSLESLMNDGEGQIKCLNFLINNCLQIFPDSLKYMAKLQNHTVFSFCAIPQIMAIATLALLYCNRGVFEGVVKIRKGQALYLIQSCTFIENDTPQDMINRFVKLSRPFLKQIAKKASLQDNEQALEISKALVSIEKWIQQN